MESLLYLHAAVESRSQRRVKQAIRGVEPVLYSLRCRRRPDVEHKQAVLLIKKCLVAAMVNRSEFIFKDLWECVHDSIRHSLLLPSGRESGILHQVVQDARSPILVQWILEKMEYNAADELDGLGRTPLMLAAAAGHRQTIKLLLKFGANPLYSDPFKKHLTAIDWACISSERCSMSNMQFLLEWIGPEDALNLVLSRVHELFAMQKMDRRRLLVLCHTIMAALTMPDIRSHIIQFYPFYAGLKQLRKLCSCDCTMATLLHLCASPLIYRDAENSSLNSVALQHFIINDMVQVCTQTLSEFDVSEPLRVSSLSAGLALLGCLHVMLSPSVTPTNPAELLSAMDNGVVSTLAIVCDVLMMVIGRYPYPNNHFMQDVIRLLNPHFKESLQLIVNTMCYSSTSQQSSASSSLTQLHSVCPDLRPSCPPGMETKLSFSCGHRLPDIDDDAECFDTILPAQKPRIPTRQTCFDSDDDECQYSEDNTNYVHVMPCWSDEICQLMSMNISWAKMTEFPQSTEQNPDPMSDTLWRKVFHPTDEEELGLAEVLTAEALAVDIKDVLDACKLAGEDLQSLGGEIVKHCGGRKTYAQACHLTGGYVTGTSTPNSPCPINGNKNNGEETSDFMQCVMQTTHEAMQAIFSSPDPFCLSSDEIELVNKDSFEANVYRKFCNERNFMMLSDSCEPVNAMPPALPAPVSPTVEESKPKIVRASSPLRPPMDPVGLVANIPKVICRRFEHKYDALKQATMQCYVENNDEAGQSLLIPQDPDFELGRSSFGGKVVLALAKRTSGELAVVAVRSFSVSEQSDRYIRRLQEFVQPWKVHEGYLLPYRIFEQRSDLGLWFLARDVCDWSLDEFLLDRPITPPTSGEAYDQGISLVYQMFSGLHFLHDRTQNVFHGNLKPTNLLIDARNVLRLVDFGFGKLCTLRHSYDGIVTLESNRLHALCWKPPEFFSVMKTYVSQSDVHSAGMLAHYILTFARCHPFITDPHMSLREFQMRVCNGLSRLHDEHGNNLPAEGAHFLLNTLSPEASQRCEASALVEQPFFWTRRKKSAFVRGVASLVTESGVVRVPKTDVKLINHCVDLAGKDWRDSLSAEALTLVFSTGTSMPSVLGLLAFVHKWHKQIARGKVSSICGILEDFYLDDFPWLVMHLYTVVCSAPWRQQASQLHMFFPST